MSFDIMKRGYGTTDVGGPLKCPRCKGTDIKLLRSEGPMDYYRCHRLMTHVKTGAFKECGQPFRYLRNSMDPETPYVAIKNDPGIALGTNSKFVKKPSYRKIKII